MIIDEIRDARLNAGIDKWKYALGIGTLVFPTGMGKTRAGLIALTKIRTKYLDAPIIILVPSDAARKTWYQEFSKFDISMFNVEVLTVHQALIDSKARELNCILLIIDEIHRFSTDDRMLLAFKQIISKFKLGLTATMPNKYSALYKVLADTCPIVDKISDEEAVDKNWISEFIEYNLALELLEDDRKVYNEYTNFMSTILKKYEVPNELCEHLLISSYNKSELIILLVIGSKHKPSTYYRDEVSKYYGWSKDLDLTSEYNQQIHEEFNPGRIYTDCDAYMQIVRKRNKILYNNIVKEDVTLEIVRIFPNTKTIIFSQSTEFADQITSKLNKNNISCTSYHTRLKSKPMIDVNTNDFIRYQSGAKKGKPKMFGSRILKNAATEGIRSGQFRIISTVAALDEGFNVQDLGMAIISSGSISSIQQIQRSGRIKRIDFNNPSKKAYIINLYFANTRDEVKLRERQLNNNSIWITNVGDII